MLRLSVPNGSGWVCPRPKHRVGSSTCARAGPSGAKPEVVTTGIVFNPMVEAQAEISTVDSAALGVADSSFARTHYIQGVEAAVNEQINVEYTISYVYHALSTYFDRDNVSLPGLAAYFREQSDEEKGHAQMLIDLQNTRGGRVALAAIGPPQTEYVHADKGDALYAMEISLALERLNYEKLLALYDVADQQCDAQMTSFLENMLEDQVKDIKRVADYVAQLRRLGKGHGAWHFDRLLSEGKVDARTY